MGMGSDMAARGSALGSGYVCASRTGTGLSFLRRCLNLGSDTCMDYYHISGLTKGEKGDEGGPVIDILMKRWDPFQGYLPISSQMIKEIFFFI